MLMVVSYRISSSNKNRVARSSSCSQNSNVVTLDRRFFAKRQKGEVRTSRAGADFTDERCATRRVVRASIGLQDPENSATLFRRRGLDAIERACPGLTCACRVTQYVGAFRALGCWPARTRVCETRPQQRLLLLRYSAGPS